MIAWASGFTIGVGRFSRPLRGVGVIAMWDAGLDSTRCVEVPLGAGVLSLFAPGVGVEVSIDHQCVADRVEVTG
jgi:hypothetical protein